MALRLGIGVAAGPDARALASVGQVAEGLGFDSAWCNDSPAGDGLAQLAVWGQSTGRIALGVGVLSLDRYAPQDIAVRARQLGIGLDRVLFGIGPGFNPTPVQATRQGVGELRRLLPEARLVVAAMGPKMCELAGEVGDGVLLNWMTPERAKVARDLIHKGATSAGRNPAEVTIYGYVRTAAGPDAKERLAREAAFYMGLPHYARHFATMEAEPATIGVAVSAAVEVPEELARWTALDVVVVRALSERTAEAITAIAAAAARS